MTWLALKCAKKFFVRLLMHLMALGDLFGSQDIGRNKRGGHMTRQSVSMIPNVRWWRFFRFHSLSKPFSMNFSNKISEFQQFWKAVCCKDCKKYIDQRIFLPSNKFLEGNISPQLSNKVRGVFVNTTSMICGSQTCGEDDFYMFSC